MRKTNTERRKEAAPAIVVVATLAVAAVLLARGASEGGAPLSRDLDSYTLFAIDALRAKGLDIADGNVGVNDGELRVSTHGAVNAPVSQIAAETVGIPLESTCAGLFANSGSATGPSCGPAMPFSGPILPDPAQACGFPDPFPACNPSLPITVRPDEECTGDAAPGNGRCDLVPGVYGTLRVLGTVVLTGGSYVFCSVRAGRAAAIIADGPVQVNVTADLDLGNGAIFGPAPGSGVSVDDVEVFVAGLRAHFSRESRARGRFCTPLAQLRMTRGASLEGRAVALTIRAERVQARRTPSPTTTTTATTPTSTSTSTTATSTSTTSTSTSTSSTTTTTLPCTIAIALIQGAVKNTVGDFTALTNPHDPGRLFVDSITNRPLLADADHQHIIPVAEMPPALNPANYEVLWEARDPDDPANHVDVDPNDGGTAAAPLGTLAKGGDNVDTLPEEGAHFFRENLPVHAISAQASPGSDGSDAATVIGTARTAIDNDRITTVRFHYGDEGGDNYILTAKCVNKTTGMVEAMDSTNTLTVWRKRNVEAYAMATSTTSTTTSTSTTTTTSTSTTSTTGTDPTTTTTSTTTTTTTSTTTTTLAGRTLYRVLGSAAEITSVLQMAYANTAQPNQNTYVDFEVREPGGSQGTMYFNDIVDDCMGAAGCADIGSYAIDYTNFHVGPGFDEHEDYVYQALGIRKQEGFFGDTGREPHSYIPVAFIEDDNTRELIGVNDGGGPNPGDAKFMIAKNDKIRITVADESGANAATKDITFDDPVNNTFNDGKATAAEVEAEINADNGVPALPILARVIAYPTRGGAPLNSQFRLVIELTAGAEGKTLRVDDLVGTTCSTVGIDCGVVQNDKRQVSKTLIHELGHNLLTQQNGVDGQVDDFDGKLIVHTTDAPCAFYQTAANSSLDICPMHAREARNRDSRAWSEHLTTYPGAATIVDDSN